MSSPLKRCLVLLLAANYALVGLFAHTAMLEERIDFFRGSIQLSETKDSPSAKQRPVWTKKRHVLSAIQTKFSVYCVPSTERVIPDEHCVFVILHRDVVCSLPSYLRLSHPRDPPAAITIAA